MINSFVYSVNFTSCPVFLYLWITMIISTFTSLVSPSSGFSLCCPSSVWEFTVVFESHVPALCSQYGCAFGLIFCFSTSSLLSDLDTVTWTLSWDFSSPTLCVLTPLSAGCQLCISPSFFCCFSFPPVCPFCLPLCVSVNAATGCGCRSSPSCLLLTWSHLLPPYLSPVFTQYSLNPLLNPVVYWDFCSCLFDHVFTCDPDSCLFVCVRFKPSICFNCSLSGFCHVPSGWDSSPASPL